MQSLSPSDLTILLVEPSDTQRKIIHNRLKREGVQSISEATSISEALDIISRHPPDLVASAMYFKDGDAIELLKQIRGKDESTDLPFMLVTSEYKRENLEEFKQSGVVAILPKPFTTEHLGTALNTTIDLLSFDELELDYFDVNEVRILLVDDSRLARNHIRRVLTNLGLQKITEAENGKEAIDHLNQDSFDLIVTDYNMPEVDGRMLTRYVREQSDQSHLPILMVTSESSEAHLSNIEHEGVNALCDKPFEPDYVKKIIYKLLDH